jgi:hypothetical protein
VVLEAKDMMMFKRLIQVPYISRGGWLAYAPLWFNCWALEELIVNMAMV